METNFYPFAVPNDVMPIIYDSILDNSVKMISSIGSELDRLQPDIPDVLFHYSDANAVLGIIQNKCLYASDYRFLNDSKEFIHAMDVAKTFIGESLSTDSNDYTQLIYDIAFSMNPDSAFPAQTKVFIACLTEESDSLGQWRAYGNNGRGYAVGLHTNDLHYGSDFLLNPNSRQPILGKVIYDDKSLGLLSKSMFYEMCKCVPIVIENLKNNGFDLDEPLYKMSCGIAAGVFLRGMSYISPFWKHNAFVEENEWRLVYVYDDLFENHSLPDINFRVSMDTPVPFVKVPIVKGEDSSISKIIIGPNLDFQLSRLGLDFLVEHYFEKEIEVVESRLSYRS